MRITSFLSVSYLSLVLTLTISSNLIPQTGWCDTRHFPRGTQTVVIKSVAGVRMDLLQNIAPIIEKSIAEGHYPGAVVLMGHHGQLVYRGVFGNRRILPNVAPMQADTVFDIASLTKVVATTPAIMQLVEQGKIALDAPVAHYWPEFAVNGKDKVTIRELLTHTSGLPADIPNLKNADNDQVALQHIAQMKLIHPAGESFLYSDVNFIVLAHLVERISGQRFDAYAQAHLFKPLKMKNTFFTPSVVLRDRIAPTEYHQTMMRWGVVQDPTAYAIGGVSGNAGLFSTADDLGRYAQSLLDGGQVPLDEKQRDHQSSYILGPLTIAKMITKQTPDTISDARGLGWDIDSRYTNRGVLFPINSFGHTGWTGTSLWIDPTTQTWVVILTSRAHPMPEKDNVLVEDRRRIATIISASIVDVPPLSFNNTGRGELERAYASSHR